MCEPEDISLFPWILKNYFYQLRFCVCVFGADSEFNPIFKTILLLTDFLME